MIPVNIQMLDTRAKTPEYATSGAACFDLYALEDAVIGAASASTVRTGLAFEIPFGWAMIVHSRSGHGFKHGVRLANSAGIIDSDYRGEVMVRLHNDGLVPFYVKAGDRIAQGMLVEAPLVQFRTVVAVSETDRGTGGFGSTGV